MFNSLKIFLHQGKQFIPNVRTAKAPGVFRGRPVISTEKVDEQAFAGVCPSGAISTSPVSIDLGKCLFCGECERCFPNKVHFTDDTHLATNVRERLIIREGEDKPIEIDRDAIRPEIRKIFKGSLKLRQVSAGGDGSCEAELNATGNVQFDLGRYGIEFAASPRHADGVLITGPISANMAKALELTYEACPEPRVVILDGTDAISGGMYAGSADAIAGGKCTGSRDSVNGVKCAGSADLDRSFLDTHHVDLYIPGNPAHPLTVINGLLDLTGRK